MFSPQPPMSVLRAFGVDGPPELLAGGQGASWLCGDLVLKPGGGAVYGWLAEALADVSPRGLRLVCPVRTLDGAWSFAGWSATRWVAGAAPDPTEPSTWLRVIEAGRAFHRAVAHLDRPDCLDGRDDRWAVADRVAWGERDVDLCPELSDVARRLKRAGEPLGASQIVHGDLTGNVVLSPSLRPAVIDISPYWRPPAYAEGVVLADALCWHGAQASLVDEAGVSVPAVARALLFRMTTTSLAASSGEARVDLADEARRYRLAAAMIGL